MHPLALEGPAEVEQACGERYRKQVSDLGMGHGKREMQKRLYVWGYDATKQACKDWLQRYRLGDGQWTELQPCMSFPDRISSAGATWTA